MTTSLKAVFFAFASLARAQYSPGGRYGPDGQNNPNNDNNDFSGGRDGFNFQSFLSSREKLLIAHGVLASLALVIFFPLGSILVRVGSFRGLWLIHGLFQSFAYLIYIIAFGMGVWLVNNIPVNLLDHYHPIIGIIVFALLFFQPILGLLHHYQFKKYSRRTLWSYGHLWLGRIVITLGIINGGLGMLLATETGTFVPSRGQMIAYGVVAGIMWLAWIGAAVVGERRRGRAVGKEAEVGPSAYGNKEQYAYYGEQ